MKNHIAPLLLILVVTSATASPTLTRNPTNHPQLADEVVLANLGRPETLKAAFAGAHGVFLVTNPRSFILCNCLMPSHFRLLSNASASGSKE